MQRPYEGKLHKWALISSSSVCSPSCWFRLWSCFWNEEDTPSPHTHSNTWRQAHSPSLSCFPHIQRTYACIPHTSTVIHHAPCFISDACSSLCPLAGASSRMLCCVWARVGTYALQAVGGGWRANANRDFLTRRLKNILRIQWQLTKGVSQITQRHIPGKIMIVRGIRCLFSCWDSDEDIDSRFNLRLHPVAGKCSSAERGIMQKAWLRKRNKILNSREISSFNLKHF